MHLGFRVANFVPFIEDQAVPLVVVQEALGVHDRVRGQDDTLEVCQVTDTLQAIRAIKHTNRHLVISEALNLVTPLTYDGLGHHDECLGEWIAAHHRHQLGRLADTHLVAQETTTNSVVILAFQEPLDASGLEWGKEGQRHF